MKKKIMFGLIVVFSLNSCASDKYSCNAPGNEEAMGCVKTAEVYRVKVLGGKKNGSEQIKNKPQEMTVRASDGAHILTQPDILDRQIHRFRGSVQKIGKGSPLLVRPITREPTYRSVYLPGETVITSGGKPMRVMPRVLVVEQIPGGFVDGPLDGSATTPLQYHIPIKSQFQKTAAPKKSK